MRRRLFIKSAGAIGSFIPFVSSQNVYAAKESFKGVGMCDWNLGTSADPSFIERAREAHLEGIQVSVGTAPDRMPLREMRVRKQYIELGRRHNIAFHSVAAGSILNRIPLKTEPQSAVYVIDALEAAKALGADNILIAFFGNGDLRLQNPNGEFRDLKDGEYSSYELDGRAIDRVVEVLQQIAPRAEDMGVALGLENTLTAKQNLEIIERIGSEMAKVYYDVGNSTRFGYNPPEEIRLLGTRHICEVHIKDPGTPLLGSSEGIVDMKACAEALKGIGYNKWYVLETSGRKDQFLEDTQSNVAFVKEVYG
ncbi:MAG: sugar phosphate isomerase/epimerase [Cyclobacteriaceae bacterium]|nr:sugar phosphate isomerase/epimerase [Cyclobacteriaceae bacterium]